MAGSVTDLEREEVAGERRHWVRISRTCNNHCVFCLDSDVQDGTMIPATEVEAEISRGIELGASRLILSGGEASIHPDFVRLIRFGKAAGYAHVQTISNGRMFAYRGFSRQALDAGLDEITFSMHGHTPELHDELTGVAGSFMQTVAGIRNVVADGRCIVSGDVVVNRLNVSHLRDILDLFIGLGIREFDILMVVPFGRASPRDGGDDLLFDLEEQLVHLHRALELSRDPGLHVWTNRMDPRLLEGYEHLIQDPYKLHDEVNGRRAILADLVQGRPMRCAGERCSHCFIRGLCESMRRAVRLLRRGVPGVLMVDASAGELEPSVRKLVKRRRDVLWIRASNASEAASVPGIGSARSLWLELRDLGGLQGAVAAGDIPAPQRIFAGSPGAMTDASRAVFQELVILLNGSTAGQIQSSIHRARRAGARALVAYRPTLTLKEAVENDVTDLGDCLGGLEADGYIDLPPCVSGGREVIYDDPLDASVVGPDGLVDPEAFVDHFIRWGYRVKSTRCSSCVKVRSCRGIGINLARRVGLRIMQPLGRH